MTCRLITTIFDCDTARSLPMLDLGLSILLTHYLTYLLHIFYIQKNTKITNEPLAGLFLHLFHSLFLLVCVHLYYHRTIEFKTKPQCSITWWILHSKTFFRLSMLALYLTNLARFDKTVARVIQAHGSTIDLIPIVPIVNLSSWL